MVTISPANLGRRFCSHDYFQPNDAAAPIRSVMTESAEAVVVAWYVQSGQTITAHRHPHGQDTWTILRGTGEYVLDDGGSIQTIVAGDVVVAPIGAVHGVTNSSREPLIFISIVAPGAAGYEVVKMGA
jgi:quercetin dioxygenase-like cupin family protein